jgi:hypothetical protein
MMDRALLVVLTLMPAVPAALRFRRSVRERTARWSRSIIVWGALTIVAGVALYSSVAVAVFAAVAHAAPEDKADVLATGLARGSPALTAGLVVGALLCVVGGVTRSAFSPPPEPKRRSKASK